MDLISAAYGWSDEYILSKTLRRLMQITAAIQRRQWHDDLAHRRVETAKLRALCTYIAAGIQAEGVDAMISEAQAMSLGTGTEAPETATRPPAVGAGPQVVRAGTPAPAAAAGPLPDAPPSVRVGQPAPIPAGIRLNDAGQLSRMLSS